VIRRLDPLRDDAGVRLRTARQRRGMTQTVLADLACISPALVSMIETGQRPLRSADHIFALADVLRVSPRFLIEASKNLPHQGSPPRGQSPSRPAATPSRWLATISSPTGSSNSSATTAAPPGTGCADWPATPPCIRGCCSTSSPRSRPIPRSSPRR
jgi:transcriptional regulator with XRE-family HTH domain